MNTHTYTVTRTDRYGRPLAGAPSRKYRTETPEQAAQFYVMADGHRDYTDGGSNMGRYTLNPTGMGSPITVLVIQDPPPMSQEEARNVIRGMNRENFDSELADRACSVLSDFDPVFTESIR